MAKANIERENLQERITLVLGNVTDMHMFDDCEFSFMACVGAVLLYTLDQRFRAMEELTRVAKPGAYLVVQVQRKTGTILNKLLKGELQKALEIHYGAPFYDGYGVRSHLYTVEEIVGLVKTFG